MLAPSDLGASPDGASRSNVLARMQPFHDTTKKTHFLKNNKEQKTIPRATMVRP
jgi:hypothetical protein